MWAYNRSMTVAFSCLCVPVALEKGQDDLTRPAIDAAAAMAKTFGAKLHIVSAVPARGLLDLDGLDDEYHETMSGMRDAELRISRGLMKQLAAEYAKKGITCTAEVVAKSTHIADQVVEAATAAGADLIVIPTHSKKGVTRLILGSVAERVARTAPQSVMLLRL